MDFPVGWATFALAMATFAVAFLAYLNFRETTKQRKAAEDQARALREQTDVQVKQRVKVVGILLSKRKEHSIVKYREAWLPLASGSLPTPKQKMTNVVLEYLGCLRSDDRLFPFGRSRAWQIVHSFSPAFWCHLFRALGENFLYDAWDHDMLAVSDYVKVNPRTLEKYIRRSYEKYRPV